MSASLETYIDYCRTRVVRASRKVTSRSKGSGAITVAVSNGLHAGNQACISADSFTIGCEAGHDLMLLDDGVEGAPVRIARQSTLLGQLLDISSDRDDLLINGAPPTPGVGREKLPCKIQIGDVELALGDDQPGTAPTHTPLRNVAAGALLLVAGGAFALSLMPTTHSGAAVLFDSHDSAAAAPDAINLDERLATAVEASGLSTYLRLSTGASGSVSVDGTLPSDRMEDWRRLRAELDAQAPSGVVIANVRAAAKLSNLPAISAVILGESPRIVYADGRDAGLGDLMLKQWTIDQITRDNFVLSRDGEQVVVEY